MASWPSFSAYSTLKMEAIRSSEKLVDFQRTTRRYIPEDRASAFRNKCCKNPKIIQNVRRLLERCMCEEENDTKMDRKNYNMVMQNDLLQDMDQFLGFLLTSSRTFN
jgi:hypothetical protein